MSLVADSRTLSAAEHERAMSEYGRRAEARAHALGNRGPIRLGADRHDPPVSDADRALEDVEAVVHREDRCVSNQRRSLGNGCAGHVTQIIADSGNKRDADYRWLRRINGTRIVADNQE